jgi:EAL domain-containing protein (putative c-di-GMP-specific phosphodiesterase class I)
LCRSLGLRAIAEGIETREQLEGARAAGVDAVQGFAVAGVLTAQDAPAHLPGGRQADRQDGRVPVGRTPA